MATIVGGIATSHTPTIGFALDTNKQLTSIHDILANQIAVAAPKPATAN